MIPYKLGAPDGGPPGQGSQNQPSQVALQPSPPPEDLPEADTLFSSDDFRMWCMKVIPCTKRFVHDWSLCPFAHVGERSARRDPRTHAYTGIACRETKQGTICPRGEHCCFAHNAFEFWLHPTRYRTQLCRDGPHCKRSVCFFAHSLEELRTPAVVPYVSPEALAHTSLEAARQTLVPPGGQLPQASQYRAGGSGGGGGGLAGAEHGGPAAAMGRRLPTPGAAPSVPSLGQLGLGHPGAGPAAAEPEGPAAGPASWHPAFLVSRLPATGSEATAGSTLPAQGLLAARVQLQPTLGNTLGNTIPAMAEAASQLACGLAAGSMGSMGGAAQEVGAALRVLSPAALCSGSDDGPSMAQQATALLGGGLASWGDLGGTSHATLAVWLNSLLEAAAQLACQRPSAVAFGAPLPGGVASMEGSRSSASAAAPPSPPPEPSALRSGSVGTRSGAPVFGEAAAGDALAPGTPCLGIGSTLE